MEVPIHKLDINDCVLELIANTNNTNSVPHQNAVLTRQEILYTVRDEGHLSFSAKVCAILISISSVRVWTTAAELHSFLLLNYLFVFVLP